MAKLSGKQQANIERMWELEAEREENMQEIAAAVRDLAAARVKIVAEIDAIETQVPDSSEVAWSEADSEHSKARRQSNYWDKDRGASKLLQQILGEYPAR
jgi:hypothetical protein